MRKPRSLRGAAVPETFNRLLFESIEPRRYLSITFAAPRPLPRSANESHFGSIVQGNFGNGHPDIAALDQGANGTAGSVKVFLNNGAGKFTLSQTLTTGGGSAIMQAVDLYGDGKLDLIVSNAGDDTLDIFTGNGNGTFATTPVVFTFGPQEVFSGISVFSDPFQVGPLLGAGQPDGIVIANQYASDTVAIQPTKSTAVRASLKTFPQLPTGSYFLVVAVSDPLGGVQSVVSTTTYTVTAGRLAVGACRQFEKLFRTSPQAASAGNRH